MIYLKFQPGKPDQYCHAYTYDNDNRIIEVKTSTDNTLFNTDAIYEYYPHGPLAKTIYGNNLQGLDHVYTLQGWLKSMNLVPSATDGKTIEDPGMDGNATTDNSNANVAADVYAYGLAYYNSDYLPIGGNAAPMGALTAANTMLNNTNSLYNGNIAFTTSYMNTGNASFNQKIMPLLY